LDKEEKSRKKSINQLRESQSKPDDGTILITVEKKDSFVLPDDLEEKRGSIYNENQKSNSDS
jgi:hypothetical protein